MKGRYGVEVPNNYSPEDFAPGTEVALDPNSFKVTDIVEKRKRRRVQLCRYRCIFL